MPGDLLSVMTGGLVKPLYHRVRNLNLADRLASMYFVNPDPSAACAPFVVNANNRGIDVRERALRNPHKFGLADAGAY